MAQSPEHHRPGAVERNSRLSTPARMARFRGTPDEPLPAHNQQAIPEPILAVSVEQQQRTLHEMETRVHRVPHCGRRNEEPLDRRMDAQPRKNDRGLVPLQASAHLMGERRSMVYGHTG